MCREQSPSFCFPGVWRTGIHGKEEYLSCIVEGMWDQIHLGIPQNPRLLQHNQHRHCKPWVLH